MTLVKISQALGDDAILRELGARIAALRLERNLTQAALATAAGVSKRTVERLEAGAVAPQLSGFVRVCRVLGLLERFEALIPEPLPSPLAQLEARGRVRRRASRHGRGEETPRKRSSWTWSDET